MNKKQQYVHVNLKKMITSIVSICILFLRAQQKL